VDFWVVGCCGFDCLCWAEVEVLSKVEWRGLDREVVFILIPGFDLIL
jgi:hypothetical protein